MNDQLVSVYKVHEYLTGSPPSISNLSDRVEAQKAIYLAAIVGVYCGDYTYTWYMKGPYSPALTKMLYDNVYELNNSNFNIYSLREDVKEVLDPLKTMINNNPIEKSIVDWMELLASVHYIYIHKIRNKNLYEVTKELLSYKSKKKYTSAEIEKAYTTLEKNGFIS